MPRVQADEQAPGLLASYTADPRRWDELLGPDGAVRPAWQPLIASISAAPSADARRTLEQTRRLISENGVTYNVYADPQGTDRPWTLDPLPVLIPGEEWHLLERALAQRARLLDLVLADLYGPQQLLAQGLVPSELPFGHPNFLWPCVGIAPARGVRLNLYAADLARSPDGRWWVLADRTQAPSGAGYALENREIIEQVMPEPLAALKARRISGFFAALREELTGHAAPGEAPLAVVLTPGPFNETYFEQAYLARQMGLPLVEGSDLTVRADTVYLKTLAGLKRVHAILRRLDDDYCDPVELRSDSALGVAGLLGAVRAGRVHLANALGTGVLESAAWLGFLPRIAQALLGEELLLPTVATWWCGERPALDYVLTHLDQLVIKPAFPNQRFEPVFGRSVTGEARVRLVQRLLRHPHIYVGQEYVALSQTPAWRPGAAGLTARSMMIRTYCLNGAAGPQVLPGGLARVAAGTTADVVSTQRGGGSKDVWVLAPPGGGAPVGPAAAGVPLTRTTGIPSRLVDNLYWYGRHLVRCDNKARLLRRALAKRTDGGMAQFATLICEYYGLAQPGQGLGDCLYEEANALGLIADVRRLAWCASQVRARLPASAWRAVADLQRLLHEALATREDPRAVLDQLLRLLAALSGHAADDMTQDAGWRLMRVGQRLERMQFVAELLAVHLSAEGAAQPLHIEWLLDACDCTRVYRSRYAATPRLAALLDLLVRDVEQPRSLSFLAAGIAQDLVVLEKALGDPARRAHEALEPGPAGLPVPVPQLSDAALLALQDEDAAALRKTLAATLQGLSEGAGALSDQLSLRHFSHIRLGSQALAT